MTAADDPIARLRTLIAGDEALQARLAAIGDRDRFAAETAAAATAAGIALSAAEVTAAAAPDLLNVGRFDNHPPNHAGWPGRGWLPVGMAPSPAGWTISWNHFGSARLDQPFFEDSQRRSNWLPLNQLMKLRTPIAMLLDPPPPDADKQPDGLIFHMSRCGSTLVSQMMAAMSDTVAVSEAPAFDAMLQLVHLNPGVPLAERVGLLRGMAAAIGRDRFGDRRHVVIKTDFWHAIELPLLRAAFPDAPWAFIFREPLDVIVSQMRQRGFQTVPGALPDSVYGIADPLAFAPEDYVAETLAAVCGAAIEHREVGGGLFVDYADLPAAVPERIMPHFGLEPTPSDARAVDAAAARDSKASTPVGFQADSQGKREEASPAARAAAHRLDDIHNQLKTLAAVR